MGRLLSWSAQLRMKQNVSSFLELELALAWAGLDWAHTRSARAVAGNLWRAATSDGRPHDEQEPVTHVM